MVPNLLVFSKDFRLVILPLSLVLAHTITLNYPSSLSPTDPMSPGGIVDIHENSFFWFIYKMNK